MKILSHLPIFYQHLLQSCTCALHFAVTMTEERLVTEVPSSLKQLARLVVRGFYTIEDALIVDMLVRNPCK